MWTAACASCNYRAEGGTYLAVETGADQHELETGHRVSVVHAEPAA